MSDPNRPFPPSFPAYAPSDYQGNDPSGSREWTLPGHSQTAFRPYVAVDALSGQAEDPAVTSRTSTGERPLNFKVAIPRTASSSHWTSSGRVSRACENCREQKAKCSGHRPTCQRCQESGIRCSYGDRKREKTAKLLTDLTNQVQVYESLLRDLYPRLDSQSMQHVERIMNEQKRDNDHSPQSTLFSSLLGAADPLRSLDAVNNVLASSLGAIDYTEEDFNRDEKVQAMGFVGEHSELAWLYRLKRELEQDLSTPGTAASNQTRDNWDRLSVSSVSYFLDDAEFPVADDVDVSERPDPTVADKLVDSYFQLVHPTFPIIGKVIFLSQYKSFYANPLVRPGNKWMAILNLVFAIAARKVQLIQEDLDDNMDEHITYFSRAWKLSMSDVALLDHPNLQQVQVEGLVSFYLMSVGQINRSWRICGISVRSAVTMGLNLRSEINSIVHVSKEIRYRVWWSLYTLDTILCVMTGRPTSTSDDFCTTPLPVPFKEEDFWDERVAQLITDHEARNLLVGSIASKSPGKPPADSPSPPVPPTNKGKQPEQIASSAAEFLTPNVSLYFLHFVDLILIKREVIDTLYAPGAARRPWLEMEAAIASLNKQADTWLSRIPGVFQFTEVPDDHPFRRPILNLAFCFYSTKILLSQPCLRRLSRRPPGSGTPSELYEKMAALCVQSARDMLDLLPDQPDATWLYAIAPWWCILHYLVQSAAILLIDLFSKGGPGADTRLKDFNKAVLWLRAMSRKEPSSHRAWLVCFELFSNHASRLGIDPNA